MSDTTGRMESGRLWRVERYQEELRVGVVRRGE